MMNSSHRLTILEPLAKVPSGKLEVFASKQLLNYPLRVLQGKYKYLPSGEHFVTCQAYETAKFSADKL